MTRRGEEGSALILALFFFSMLSLFIVSVLTFADVGARVAKGLEAKRGRSFAADGAMEAAITRFKAGNSCDDYNAPMGPNGQPIGGQPVVVRCANLGVPASGSLNKPSHALLSLASVDSNEAGIVSTSPNLRVRGDVFSRSTIVHETGSGTMVVEGGVSALGNCNDPLNWIQTDPVTPRRCADDGAGADPVKGLDPDFAKATHTVPMRRTVPPCPTPTPPNNWLVTLEPGYYPNAAALSGLTSGTCPDSLPNGLVVWMKPGIYYLNFSLESGTPGTWAVTDDVDDNVEVIGGTPIGWNPLGTRPDLTVPDRQHCKGPGDPAPVEGVQVIVGGESRIDVAGGARFELCANPLSDNQRIALYGLPADSRSHTLKPATTAGAGFTNPGRALTIGENSAERTADADLVDGATESATLTLTGFRPGIPAGSVIDSAVLRVAHEEDLGGNMGPVTATAVFPDDTCGANAFSHNTSGIEEDTVDLVKCGLSGTDDLSGLAVTFSAELSGGTGTATARLDGMWVDVSYRAPTTRKPTDVTTFAGFPAATHERVFEIGEGPVGANTSDAPLTDGGPTTASITLAGMSDPPIPANAVIESAVLRVAHQDDDVDGADIASVTVTPNFPAPNTCGAVPLSPNFNAIGEDTVDLADCGFTDPDQLAAFTATFAATLQGGSGNAADVKLDGIWLDLVYAPTRVPTGSSGVVGFSAPANAFGIGVEPVLSSDATVDSGNPNASITLTGYGSPAVPAGSVIDSAVLRVAHQETANVGPISVTVAGAGFTPPAQLSTDVPCQLCLNTSTDFVEDRIDLKALGLDDPAEVAGLQVTYAAAHAGGGSGTARLDGIWIDLDYRAPALRQPNAASGVTVFPNPPTAAYEIDDDTADAVFTAVPPVTSASVTLQGYDAVPLPPGSLIEAASVSVAHEEVGSMGPVTMSFPGSSCGPTILDPSTAGIATQAIALPCLATADDLTGFEVTLSAVLAGASGTERLDGIEIDIVFRPPIFEPLSGCAVAGPYPGTGCAVAKAAGGTNVNPTRFIVDGTVYAPLAALDIAMINVNSQVLTRGLIARTIRLGLTPAPGYSRPTAAVPPEAVQFTAYQPSRHAAANDPPVRFNDPANAYSISERPTVLTSNADLNTVDPTGSLTLSGFDNQVLASGATVDGAVLRVAHHDNGLAPTSFESVKVTVTLPAGGGTHPYSSLDTPCSLCLRTDGMREDRIALPSGLTAEQLASATITYEAKLALGAQGTERLDGIVLEVFSGPLLRARVTFVPTGPVTVEGWSVLR